MNKIVISMKHLKDKEEVKGEINKYWTFLIQLIKIIPDISIGMN